MNQHDQANIGILFEGTFQGDRIHIPGIAFGIDKHGLAIFVSNWIQGCRKSHVTAKDLVSRKGTLPRRSATIKGLARQACTQVESRRTCAQGNRILATDLFGHQPFNLVDIFSDGAHPVG